MIHPRKHKIAAGLIEQELSMLLHGEYGLCLLSGFCFLMLLLYWLFRTLECVGVLFIDSLWNHSYKNLILQDKSSLSLSMGRAFFRCWWSLCHDDGFFCCSCWGQFDCLKVGACPKKKKNREKGSKTESHNATTFIHTLHFQFIWIVSFVSFRFRSMLYFITHSNLLR